MDSILKYTDEADKSLGIAGMAISLVACDGEDYLTAVSLAEDEDSVAMSEEFYFVSNPRFSAKIVWNELLKQYQVIAGMMLGNVLCRAYGAGRNPAREALEAVRATLGELGSEECELEKDEIDKLYNKNYAYYTRLFSHPTVATVARDFAGALQSQRRLTAGEVFEHLRRLNSL